MMARTGSREGWSDAELLAAVAGRDDAAFSVFYRRHLPVVMAFLMRETRDREAAADLAAEVFAAVMLASRRYRDEGPAAPWVLGIARNKFRASRRRGRIEERARRQLGYEPVELSDSDLARVEVLAAAGVEELLGALPVHEREAVRSRVLLERSYGDIAAELQCSELVVRKRVSRGLARIREALEKP
ncbi:MAG: RNA polymerase sigma factor [Solirubrobacteraceae bacterium]